MHQKTIKSSSAVRGGSFGKQWCQGESIKQKRSPAAAAAAAAAATTTTTSIASSGGVEKQFRIQRRQRRQQCSRGFCNPQKSIKKDREKDKKKKTNSKRGKGGKQQEEAGADVTALWQRPTVTATARYRRRLTEC